MYRPTSTLPPHSLLDDIDVAPSPLSSGNELWRKRMCLALEGLRGCNNCAAMQSWCVSITMNNSLPREQSNMRSIQMRREQAPG